MPKLPDQVLTEFFRYCNVNSSPSRNARDVLDVLAGAGLTIVPTAWADLAADRLADPLDKSTEKSDG
jgi:hypothetical protein